MNDSLTHYLAAVPGGREELRAILTPLVDRMSCYVTASAGLVIKAGGSTLAKTGSTAFQAVVQGFPVQIAGSTDMPALSGSIAANKYNVFCFFIDNQSTVTVSMGTAGDTLRDVKFPEFPQGKTLVGYLIVTHSATFTGGTTALDTATTVYVSPSGAFDPTVKV